MKTNTVVIISVVAVAGIAFYVASRPPATQTIIREKPAKLTKVQKLAGAGETIMCSMPFVNC